MKSVVIDAVDRAIWKESLIAGVPVSFYTRRLRRFAGIFRTSVNRRWIPADKVFLQPGGPIIKGRPDGFAMPWLYESVEGGRYHLHSSEQSGNGLSGEQPHNNNGVWSMVHSFQLCPEAIRREMKSASWVLMRGMDEVIATEAHGHNHVDAVFSEKYTILMTPPGEELALYRDIVIDDILPVLLDVATGTGKVIGDDCCAADAR